MGRLLRKSPTQLGGANQDEPPAGGARLFPVALEGDAGGGLGRESPGKSSGVTPTTMPALAFAPARILAHAVGDEAARFGRGRDHRAARHMQNE